MLFINLMILKTLILTDQNIKDYTEESMYYLFTERLRFTLAISYNQN